MKHYFSPQASLLGGVFYAIIRVQNKGIRVQKEGFMGYVYYNPNPLKRAVGDCAVRAVAKALDTDWETAYIEITINGYGMGDMPSSDAVWGSVLRRSGFYREVIPTDFPDGYTAEDFCRDHPRGVFVLAFGGHVATVVDGKLYDSWDSSREVPQYYWYKKEM